MPRHPSSEVESILARDVVALGLLGASLISPNLLPIAKFFIHGIDTPSLEAPLRLAATIYSHIPTPEILWDMGENILYDLDGRFVAYCAVRWSQEICLLVILAAPPIDYHHALRHLRATIENFAENPKP